METEYIYWRHLTPVGIKVEEVSGREDKKGAVWTAMAFQVYCENGAEGYREIEHTEIGAPLLAGSKCRISISHTKGLLAVASLPKTPEAALDVFSPRTAMGVDCERWDRRQVLKVRDKYLSEDELKLVSPDSLEENIIAWTAKEALFKAALNPGLDWKENYRLIKLPQPGLPTLIKGEKPQPVGKAEIIDAEGNRFEMELYCYDSEGCCVMLAYSPKCATYKKG